MWVCQWNITWHVRPQFEVNIRGVMMWCPESSEKIWIKVNDQFKGSSGSTCILISSKVRDVLCVLQSEIT